MGVWLVVVNMDMDKKTFWIIAGVVLGVLSLVVVWQTATLNVLMDVGTTSAKTVSSSASSSGMVGGC